MRHAGRVNLEAIEHGFSIAAPGTTLRQINDAIEAFVLAKGCKPAFKNYQPPGAKSPFPAAVCLSPNDVVVHGVPNDYVLRHGDLLTIDMGTEYNGWFADSARSRVIYSPASISRHEKAEHLIQATEAILDAQLSVIRDGCTFIQLIEVSEKIAGEYGVTIMAQWGGHQIGNRVHLEPFIPTGIDRRQSRLKQSLDAKKYARQVLTEGQTICVEPVVTYGTSDVIIDGDQWTVRKSNGLLAAHTERTILVLKNGFEILA